MFENSRQSRQGQFLVTVLVLAAAITVVVWDGRAETLSDTVWPRQALGEGAGGVPYVENQVCRQCHPQQYQDWTGSHHERAMQPATDQTVLGDFNDARFIHQGITSRFFKQAGKFFVHTEGQDGQMADFEIQYTFGVEPLQQYLIPRPGGRLQNLPIAWDTQRHRWFHLYPNENMTSGEPLHWTGLYQTWNVMCAECHSTNLRKNYDSATNAYQTTWSAINVNCQSCHGPGGHHVAWAQEQTPGTAKPPYSNRGLLVDFAALDARGQVDTCARCHSRRHRISVDDQPGRSLLDDFVPEVLRQGLYHADGQILDEVYEYGSFLQSKMYHAGVRCTDCHNPHSLRLKVAGNALCGQCHQAQPPERFPTLQAKAYDTPAHHFHPAGSVGAQCVNCHMPAKTYMVIDPRHDHSLRVPRPDLSVKLDTPNACTGCHAGRIAQWAADVVAHWYGSKPSPQYAEVLALGRAGRTEVLPHLAQLAGTSDQPTIVRATALELLRQYGTAGAAAMVTALQDTDPLVRVTAVGGLDRLPPQALLTAVSPLLHDSIRAVRMEAVRVLASVPPEGFTLSQRAAFDAALAEFTAVQQVMADTPSAHLNLAVLQTHQGQPALAEQSYQTALRLDPAFLPARFNLAHLYNQMHRNADAERVLREALQYAPEEGELYYSLGLLLAEEQHLEDASNVLSKAARLLPTRPRVHYNYGLVLQHLGRRPEAEAALHTAHQLDPSNGDILYALAIFHMQQEHWERAATYAEQLVSLYPDAPTPQRLLNQIRRQWKK
jgi:tetratricopeptide (TPR) repeat protein